MVTENAVGPFKSSGGVTAQDDESGRPRVFILSDIRLLREGLVSRSVAVVLHCGRRLSGACEAACGDWRARC